MGLMCFLCSRIWLFFPAPITKHLHYASAGQSPESVYNQNDDDDDDNDDETDDKDRRGANNDKRNPHACLWLMN